MIEPALEYLCRSLEQQKGKVLLIADEHLDCNAIFALKSLKNLTLLSNRYDVKLAADENNILCYFNDMDLSEPSETFDVIAYRISKEKAIVHHVINQAPRHLNPGGQLILSGYKNEGMKTYISKTEHYLDCKAQISKGERQLKTASFLPQSIGDTLDDKNYDEMISIAQHHDTEVLSKPGQFGWNKLDQGSIHLIEIFQQHISTSSEPPKTLLDLGCGYGFLSIYAWSLGLQNITATDNNAAAIASSSANFQLHGIQGQVIPDDCAASIEERFDVLLCNPPFHKGFDTEKALTERFIKSAQQHLKKSGVAFFVTNQFISIEQSAATYFKGIETVFKDKSFKVVKLSS